MKGNSSHTWTHSRSTSEATNIVISTSGAVPVGLLWCFQMNRFRLIQSVVDRFLQKVLDCNNLTGLSTNFLRAIQGHHLIDTIVLRRTPYAGPEVRFVVIELFAMTPHKASRKQSVQYAILVFIFSFYFVSTPLSMWLPATLDWNNSSTETHENIDRLRFSR